MSHFRMESSVIVNSKVNGLDWNSNVNWFGLEYSNVQCSFQDIHFRFTLGYPEVQ